MNHQTAAGWDLYYLILLILSHICCIVATQALNMPAMTMLPGVFATFFCVIIIFQIGKYGGSRSEDGGEMKGTGARRASREKGRGGTSSRRIAV